MNVEESRKLYRKYGSVGESIYRILDNRVGITLSELRVTLFFHNDTDFFGSFCRLKADGFLDVFKHEKYGICVRRTDKKIVYERVPIKRKMRTRILERDAYRCRHCGGWLNLCVDHIVPVAMGGTNDESNLQTLCRSCNLKKGARYVG